MGRRQGSVSGGNADWRRGYDRGSSRGTASVVAVQGVSGSARGAARDQEQNRDEFAMATAAAAAGWFISGRSDADLDNAGASGETLIGDVNINRDFPRDLVKAQPRRRRRALRAAVDAVRRPVRGLEDGQPQQAVVAARGAVEEAVRARLALAGALLSKGFVGAVLPVLITLPMWWSSRARRICF